jgi:primosomal protein N' (replication factor Y)
MTYYHVWVRSNQYRSNEPLTYEYADKLAIGKIIEVPLRRQRVLGIVVKSVPKPNFATKSIFSVYNLPQLPINTLAIAVWLQQYYPSPLGVITQLFLPRKISQKSIDLPLNQNPNFENIKTTKLPPITKEQRLALDLINQPDTYIVHGRTGSGKTRLYIELTKRALSGGKSVLILCPEIGLTSQLAANFKQSFKDQVVVFHSQLTQKEHEIAWLTVLKANSPLIVIGPRSALFCPINNLGLIVVDESHDQAYKQEQQPYYHAARVASQLRKIHNAVLLFGSATPSVSEYYLATQKNKQIVQLEHLALPHNLKHVLTVVDLKDQDQFSRSPHLSLPLIRAIDHSLKKKEQSLLYLNRRGTARVLLCRKCGWQAICSHCNLPLIYHGDAFRLRCHVCGFQQDPVTSCPNCGNAEITLHGFGTKAIVEEVQRIFPEARIMRFDTDNKKPERLENQYQHILKGEVDILIGTQVLAKGLDLPKLSTLGVISADTSLLLPDYTAQERTYQLLTQVLGRIGRGHVISHAIIQTFHPNSLLLQSILQNDWKNFYDNEINERRNYYFPPFCHIIKLSCRRSSVANAIKAANVLKNTLTAAKLDIQIEGPAPAYHEKIGSKYQWQLVVKSKKRSQLLETIKLLPSGGWSYDLDPADLL